MTRASTTDKTSATRERDAEIVPHALQSLLDAAVRGDGSFPGLRGTIAIGVRSTRGDVWWCARLGANADTWFGGSLPRDVDAALLMGVNEADCIVDHGELPGEATLLQIQGDGALLVAAVNRYTRKRSAISLRARVHNRKENGHA
jgi:hypothetical protein